MAIRFREIPEKSERLLEQGQEADETVRLSQSMVSAAQVRVQSAHQALSEASETGEDGQTRGDVLSAQIRLRMAEGQLSAAQRALDAAHREAERVKDEKLGHVRFIEQHNRTAQENMRKLRSLGQKAFNTSLMPLAQEIADHHNQASAAQAQLLRSMGLAAAAATLAVPGFGPTETYSGHTGRTVAPGVGTMQPVSGGGSARAAGNGGLPRTSVANTDTWHSPASGRLNRQQELFEAYDQYRQQFRALMIRHADDPAACAAAIAALDRQYAQLAGSKGWVASNNLNSRLFGVLFPDDFTPSSRYAGQLQSRIELAEPEVGRVFAALSERLEVCNSRLEGVTPHFAPADGFNVVNDPQKQTAEISYEKRGIHYSAAADEQEKRGPGTVFFHETGHMVDHLASGVAGAPLSDDIAFRQAIEEDKTAFLSAYQALQPADQTVFLRWLRDDDYSKHSLSDLLGGLTGNEIAGLWTHKTSYWQKGDKITKEAFAHFFEASMGAPERKLELICQFFPTAYGRFRDLIATVDVPDEQKHVLIKA